MEKYAITISRQFASMGRSIAQELAEQLHIEFLDRDIVDETAKRMNASIRQISDEEELQVFLPDVPVRTWCSGSEGRAF